MPENFYPVDIAFFYQEGVNVSRLDAGVTMGQDRFTSALNVDHKKVIWEGNFRQIEMGKKEEIFWFPLYPAIVSVQGPE